MKQPLKLKINMKNSNPIKISFRDIKYTINKERRFVSCTMTAVPRMPENTTFEYCVRYYPETFMVKGVAKCNPSDYFDESKGKIIARRKAEIKAYKQVMTKLSVYQKVLDHQYDLIANFRVKSLQVIKEFNNYLHSLETPIAKCDKSTSENPEKALWGWLVTQGFTCYMFSCIESETLHQCLLPKDEKNMSGLIYIHMDKDIPGSLILVTDNGPRCFELLPEYLQQRIYDLIVNGC